VLGCNRGARAPFLIYYGGVYMKLTKDILNCAKLALYIFLGTFAIGLVVGLISYGFNWIGMFLWGIRLSLIIACFGLAIAAFSFIKPDTMRDLDYQSHWEVYYSVLNLTQVMLIVAVFMIIYAFISDYLIRIFL
jgi:hypothetical protein